MEGPPGSWPPVAKRTALTIGVYDGVHRGHRQVISSLGETAAAEDLLLTVVSFRRHPMTILAPDRVPAQLTTLEQRLELLEGLGVEVLALLDFDEELRHLSAESFVADILVARLRPAVVAVGEDFRFGYRQQGDVSLLRTLGERHGFAVAPQPLVGGSVAFSATTAREAVAKGDPAAATAILGRPFQIRAAVVEGDGRGAGIGFPTANLAVDPDQAVPRRGVYAVRVGVDGAPVSHPGVVNIGVRPTFDGVAEVVEVHLLDFDDDLYGRVLSVDFIERIRDEQRFDGVDALVAQIARDVATAREMLRRVPSTEY